MLAKFKARPGGLWLPTFIVSLICGTFMALAVAQSDEPEQIAPAVGFVCMLGGTEVLVSEIVDRENAIVIHTETITTGEVPTAMLTCYRTAPGTK